MFVAVLIAAAALVLSWLVWTTAVMVVVAREAVKREPKFMRLKWRPRFTRLDPMPYKFDEDDE